MTELRCPRCGSAEVYAGAWCSRCAAQGHLSRMMTQEEMEASLPVWRELARTRWPGYMRTVDRRERILAEWEC